MSTTRRVFKNSTALSLSVLLERAISFILPWYVARILGREAWGDYSTAYTFVLIGATIAPWGMVSLLPRQIARDHRQVPELLVNSGLIGLGMGIVTAVGMITLTRFLNYPPAIESLIILGVLLAVIPQTESVLLEAIIQGVERMEWIVYVRLPATLLRIAGSIYLLANGFDITVLFWVLGAYHLFNCTAYLFILRRHFSPISLRFHLSGIRLLFRQALPFFIIVSTSEVFRQIDRIFLSKLWDTDAVGIYATGVMFIQLLYMLAPALMGALFPGLSRAYVKSLERFTFLVNWLFKLLAVLIFPVMLFTIAFADKMILLVFGPAYVPSIDVMRLVALGILPSFLSRILYRTILASDNERLGVNVALVGNAASLLLNVLLIPRFGVWGAGMAAVGTILVRFGQNFWYVSQLIHLDWKRSIWKPVFCMGLSSLVFGALWRQSSLLAFLGAMVMFAVLLWVTGTIAFVDLENLSLVKRKEPSGL